MYEERTYRKYMKIEDWVQFQVIEGESDLQIAARKNLEKEAKASILKYRKELQNYIKKDPSFLTSLVPIKPQKYACDIVKHMCLVGALANVGPMAAVAGAISQYVGKDLLQYTDEVMLENGGDIFLKSKTDKKILVYAGNSPFSNKIALQISGSEEPLGICTSCATVGHSLSFGNTDAVVILSKDTLLSDATASAVGNIVKNASDIQKGIQLGKSIPGIEGILIIIGDKMGAWGKINLVKI